MTFNERESFLKEIEKHMSNLAKVRLEIKSISYVLEKGTMSTLSRADDSLHDVIVDLSLLIARHHELTCYEKVENQINKTK